MKNKLEIVSTFYPEVAINGYSSVDGTVEFYARINSILQDSMTILEFGAGRGAWYEDDQCTYRKMLRTMLGKVRKVIGCDIDRVVMKNCSVDEKVVIEIGEALPFEDGSIDLIISDYVFEHIANPKEVAKEFQRILKKGGWICARTPNKYSYISLLTRLTQNSQHTNLLRLAQPGRKELDVFPTTFKLNSVNDVKRHFNSAKFENYTYRYEAEPGYHFNSKLIFALQLVINKIMPSILKVNLFIFLKKK